MPATPSDAGIGEIFASLSVGVITLIALGLTILRIGLLAYKPPRPGKPADVHPTARAFAEVFESLIIAGVLVFLIIRPFFVQAFFIPSESMEPTLLGHDSTSSRGVATGHDDTVHDHIFVNKLIYRYSEPKRGDIIVFRAPARADAEHADPNKRENVLIKRLMGIPGDRLQQRPARVKMRDGTMVEAQAMFRNGVQLDEPYIKEPMEPAPPNAGHGTISEITLGPGQLFVMGDNRNDSNDSRYWGTLDRSRVIGKANFIFFPFNRIRILH